MVYHNEISPFKIYIRETYFVHKRIIEKTQKCEEIKSTF